MAWKNADVSFRFSNWPSIDAEPIFSDILEIEDLFTDETCDVFASFFKGARASCHSCDVI